MTSSHLFSRQSRLTSNWSGRPYSHPISRPPLNMVLGVVGSFTKLSALATLGFLMSGCVQMPNYPEGSIRHHVWTNLGAPNSTAKTDSGIEGWLYKRVQGFGTSVCKSFTVWFDDEEAFLVEPIKDSDSLAYCRAKEAVDLSMFSPEKPRSPLNLLPKQNAQIVP